MLLSITKSQNLKAIHNVILSSSSLYCVVINHKTTKFESNSQRINPPLYQHISCYQSQNYKIWKQFTTFRSCYLGTIGLLSITKLQNLKVIHNCRVSRLYAKCVVINHKIWKQFTTKLNDCFIANWLLSITKLQNLKGIHNCSLEPLVSLSVVINRKTTKFESNSQLPLIITFTMFRRYQSQNYKIWKQFTTHFLSKLIRVWLLSIIKLQNLKAIHNNIHMDSSGSCVVINHKTTKFESNSQPCSGVMLRLFCCYQS